MAVFLKRHHASVRSLRGLAEEHAFLRHLRARGTPVVEVLGAHARGEWTYEAHAPGAGTDLYRDALSWTPFASAAHARQADAAPARSVQPLVSSWSIFADRDPLAALERYAAARPALAEALDRAPVRADTERLHLPFHARLAPLLGELEPLWTHNDRHASNLLWHCPADGGTERARIATVLEHLHERWCA